jgi:ankyrin repeat protein
MLHYAARFGQEEIAAFLLGLKPDVNLAAKVGATPLHFAASNGYAGVVAMLLKAGAKINTQNKRVSDLSIYRTLPYTTLHSEHRAQRRSVGCDV